MPVFFLISHKLIRFSTAMADIVAMEKTDFVLSMRASSVVVG